MKVLQAWDFGQAATAEPLDGGLINQTFRVRVGGAPVAVLQRLNTDIFVAEVHEDIEAITAHLQSRGLATPRLRRTRSGALWHEEDGVWRVLSWEGDRTIHKVADLEDARSAAALIARVHAALADFQWDFRSVRPGAHDTHRHMQALQAAVDAYPQHRLFDAVAPLADQILTGWRAWSGPGALPARIIHGDLKISNVRFEGKQALCLVDLDTFAWGTLDVELGDAMRSWCNPASENVAQAVFSVPIFSAAMEGYLPAAAGLSDDEKASIVPGTERICWELAARFAQDALAEDYFGFDPTYGGHGEHSLLRARGQASLAASVRDQRAALEAVMGRR